MGRAHCTFIYVTFNLDHPTQDSSVVAARKLSSAKERIGTGVGGGEEEEEEEEEGEEENQKEEEITGKRSGAYLGKEISRRGQGLIGERSTEGSV